MASNDREPGGAVTPPEPAGQETGAGTNFSRRNFLKTVGVGPLAAGVLATTAEAQSGAKVLGPGRFRSS